MRRYLPVILAAGAIAAFGGCDGAKHPSASTAAPQTGAAPEAPHATGTTTHVELTKGMSATLVREQLGDPDEVKPIATSTDGAEVWIYRRTFKERAGYITSSVPNEVLGSTETQSIEGNSSQRTFTPIEGRGLREQYRDIEETTIVMVYEGRVVEWDRTRQAGPAY